GFSTRFPHLLLRLFQHAVDGGVQMLDVTGHVRDRFGGTTADPIEPAAIVRIPVEQRGVLCELGVATLEVAGKGTINVRNCLEALDRADGLSNRDQLAWSHFKTTFYEVPQHPRSKLGKADS